MNAKSLRKLLQKCATNNPHVSSGEVASSIESQLSDIQHADPSVQIKLRTVSGDHDRLISVDLGYPFIIVIGIFKDRFGIPAAIKISQVHRLQWYSIEMSPLTRMLWPDGCYSCSVIYKNNIPNIQNVINGIIADHVIQS